MMPHFEMISVDEALRRTGGGRRQQNLEPYLKFIEQLREGQAGKLMPAEGETSLTVRRRLNSAAKLAGKELEVKRSGEEVYFWLGPTATRKRRGRPRKTSFL